MWPLRSVFAVYRHATAGQAVVREGLAVWAVVFGWVWALSRRLWLTAVALGAVEALVIVPALAKIVPPWFALLLTPLRLYLGWVGGKWKAAGLERRDYAFVGTVVAHSSREALALVRAGRLTPGRRPREAAAAYWVKPPEALRPIVAVARLTLKAAFRFRLVPILSVLLFVTVMVLPAVIKHDGTARGLTQITLTYTLGLITAVLGLTTLWLACNTLARDVEECQMQMVVVKPVARWQVWLGKWLGILAFNALLLGLAAGVVYVQMLWRARSLTAEQQKILWNEVFVARGSLKEPPVDPEPMVERVLQERLKNQAVGDAEREQMRKIVREQVKAQLQVVPPGVWRRWQVPLGRLTDRLKDQYLFLRVKFFAAEQSASKTYAGIWLVGPPEGAARWRDDRSQAAETFHEFPIPPNLLGADGKLTVDFVNENSTALLFPLEDGFEVLYREGSFGMNYVRGVAILFCWLALLAALGLAAASFLSFPVAAFFSLSVLVVAFSTGTMNQVIEEGTVREIDHETGRVANANWFDHGSVAAFKGLLATVNLVRDFSPIDSLSGGRYVSWGQLARAIAQIILLAGGMLGVLGVWTFNRRELATAQGKT